MQITAALIFKKRVDVINGKQKIRKDDWQTPDWLFNALNARFAFTIDAACILSNCKVAGSLIYSDGLFSDWGGQRVFCNPPFSQKALWIKKAHDEVLLKDCPLCVMILPVCLDTIVFNEYIAGKFHWEHIPHRVSFIGDDGRPQQGNPAGTIIVYFWKKIRKE